MTTYSTTFSATGLGQTVQIQKNNPQQVGSYVLTGTFVGTLELQYSPDGRDWATLASYTTTQSAVTITTPGYYRWNCTAYTSGSPAAAFTIPGLVYQQIVNSAGQVVMSVADDGISSDLPINPTTGNVGSATGKLGFFGATPVIQRTAATTAGAAVATTGSTQTTPYGYASAAQADDIITQLNLTTARLNDLATKLKALGLIA